VFWASISDAERGNGHVANNDTHNGSPPNLTFQTGKLEEGSNRGCSHGISIADKEEGNIVTLVRTLGKILDGLKN
jgi:hypothetical protein